MLPPITAITRNIIGIVIRYIKSMAGMLAIMNFRMIATMRPKGILISVIVVFSEFI